MGKKTGNFVDLTGQQAAQPACRIAYSINNYQPVMSTIISDQPFFYMDEDIPFEEDDILMPDAFDKNGTLEKEIMDLQHKMEAYERLSEKFDADEDCVLSDFSENLEGIESKLDYRNNGEMTGLMALMNKSRMAQALIEYASSYKVDIVLSDQIMTGMYDRKSHKIYINPSLNISDMVLITARELRRHWQHRQGVMLHPLTFHPDHAVLINRAQLADLNATMIRIAWELQLAGEKDLWHRVENSSMADLGCAYAREAFLDFRTINNGDASGAVFETWFLSERCKAEDKKLIQSMLNDYQGYVFDTALEASQMISLELISKLGSQPYGKNYLAPYAQMIINDPLFTEVRDRSNANFLWFIKFERSFKEAEQELQPQEVIHNHDDRHGTSTQNIRGVENEQQENIVRLYGQNSKMSSGHDCLEKDGTGANVVYVQFGTPQS